ncbi:MAG: hypothetical protein AB1502_01800 [Thermodesulfobacteriota bacterium]
MIEQVKVKDRALDGDWGKVVEDGWVVVVLDQVVTAFAPHVEPRFPMKEAFHAIR